jgi:hypothetical protein
VHEQQRRAVSKPKLVHTKRDNGRLIQSCREYRRVRLG